MAQEKMIATVSISLNSGSIPVFFGHVMPGSTDVPRIEAQRSSLMETTDEALMVAARDGDVGAFTSLARRYAARLVAYCVQLTGSTSAAEEVAQDTWLGLWSGRKGYQPSSRFVVFLFTAARNRSKNRRRGALRAAGALGAPSATDLDSLPGVLPSGLEQVLASERRARLHAHVDQLSPALREALVLRVVDELPYADVAAILEIPEATARSRVHLAVQKLRELGRKEVLS